MQHLARVEEQVIVGLRSPNEGLVSASRTTSTFENLQAGEARPTRITCKGSPLLASEICNAVLSKASHEDVLASSDLLAPEIAFQAFARTSMVLLASSCESTAT